MTIDMPPYKFHKTAYRIDVYINKYIYTIKKYTYVFIYIYIILFTIRYIYIYTCVLIVVACK